MEAWKKLSTLQKTLLIIQVISTVLSVAVYALVEIAGVVEVTSQADVEMMGIGLLMAALGVISIFCADTLFRTEKIFTLQSIEPTEPNDSNMVGRTASQVLLTVVAVICYVAVWL